MCTQERWEKSVLKWGEDNESKGSLRLFRAATSSTSTEMLSMVLWCDSSRQKLRRRSTCLWFSVPFLARSFAHSWTQRFVLGGRSIPLVMITITVMISYVICVFLRRPLKQLFKPRLKLGEYSSNLPLLVKYGAILTDCL